MNDTFDWSQLQNGSDIRGVALDGVEGETVNLTAGRVRAIGAAFVSWLRAHKRAETPRISVGMDPRLTGPALKAALVDGLISTGADVGDAQLATTPAMFMSTVFHEHDYDGAIMLTASHLPFDRNGMKFFTKEGGVDNVVITELLERAPMEDRRAADLRGDVQPIDLMDDYASFLVRLVREEVNHPDHYSQPLRGHKIIVDSGNGSGGFFVDKVLVPLGADTTGSQHLEPDGRFPNHVPNPEAQEAMESVRLSVLKHEADMGIIFDTDVDRAAVVGRTGRVINRNRLIGLVSAIVLEEHPGSTIVTDSITSDGLQRFIEEKLRGRHLRFKRGYRNVINEAVRLNKRGQDTHLAIETSGHAALKENHFLDDGAYVITKLLIKMARLRHESAESLESLIQELPEPAASSEFRMKITTAHFKTYGKNIIHQLSEFATNTEGFDIVPRNYEGIRVACSRPCDEGWFLLRLSLHDPLLVLNVESVQIHGVDKIVKVLMRFLNKYQDLDTGSIRRFLNASSDGDRL